MLSIDHVTLACSELESLRAALAELGLATTYGGAHANGVTHMAARGLADGTYLELISRLPGPAASADRGWWPRAIESDAGPCAWSLACDDAAAEAARVARLGVSVSGPHAHQRTRPDGAVVRWEMVFLGDGEPGSLLPFAIQDRTPRPLRVPAAPTGSSAAGLPTGIAQVVVAVTDMPAAIELFRRVYALDAPSTGHSPRLGADLACFSGQPLSLAVPASSSGWLAQRLARHGSGPCAFLLGTENLEAADGRHALFPAEPWPGRRVAWFEPAALPDHGGHVLGISADS